MAAYSLLSVCGPLATCQTVKRWATYSTVTANISCLAFEEAEKNAPAIIFIDELDAIAPKRDKVCTCHIEPGLVVSLTH